jgi:hypothetical protein
MRLYRSQEHPDHWIGEDEHGVLMLWSARPRGWVRRTGYLGARRQLEEVEPALARGAVRRPRTEGEVPERRGEQDDRLTNEERAAWEKAAGDRKLSDWMRDTLNAAAAAATPPARTSRSKAKP